MARHSPGTRLELGASVLAAARVVDTTRVENRLARFRHAHRVYARAQAKVEAAEKEVRAAREQVASSVRAQKEAVYGLARALVSDGHPLANPFEKFRAPTLGRLARLPPAEAAQAVHHLVREVRRSGRAGEPTVEAAEEADAAARAIEERLRALPEVEQKLRDARTTRDTHAPDWHAALTALKNDARAAGYEGARDLHAKLFPPVGRVRGKGGGREPGDGRAEGAKVRPGEVGSAGAVADSEPARSAT
jgi:hypothetical protein